MPARNIYHNAVAHALVADGWTITDDPFRLTFGARELYVDLGAERVVVAAERGTRRIAVEVQSFLNSSPVRDLQEAVGQYEIYRTLMTETEPDRQLYMAVPRTVYNGVFTEQFGQLIVTRLHLRLLVFDEVLEGVVQWIE
jgi:hypothetical protein